MFSLCHGPSSTSSRFLHERCVGQGKWRGYGRFSSKASIYRQFGSRCDIRHVHFDTVARITKRPRRHAMESTGFDALKRPLTLKLPSTELITLTYDRKGRTRCGRCSDLLVDNITYNGRGQMARLERPNTLDTVLTYYNATGTAGTGNSSFRLSNITAGSLLNLAILTTKWAT